jgi:polysaccharide export outer membrane protein
MGSFKMMPVGWLIVGAAAFVLSGCGGAPKGRPISELEPAPTSVVQPGDVVVIEFWNEEQLSGERIVNRSGNIMLPLVGPIHVAGLDAYQIQDKLIDFYAQYYSEPLIVANIRLGVNVTGEVRIPGRYPVDPAFNVLDVFGVAGGLTYDANTEEIEFNRGGQRYILNLDDAQLSDDPDVLRMQSGDWVYVPRRFWTLQRTATYISLTSITLSVIALIVSLSN